MSELKQVAKAPNMLRYVQINGIHVFELHAESGEDDHNCVLVWLHQSEW